MRIFRGVSVLTAALAASFILSAIPYPVPGPAGGAAMAQDAEGAKKGKQRSANGTLVGVDEVRVVPMAQTLPLVGRLVTYTLSNVRDSGMTPEDAILDSTETRIRPIFMSTLTTVFGMLPLVLAPGAGSELYRGLGAVVVGGLSLSAILTLIIIPPLMSLMSWKLRPEMGRTHLIEHEHTTAPAE